MTGSHGLRTCKWLAVVAIVTICLLGSFKAALPYFDSSDAFCYLSDWRSAAGNAPGEGIALLCDNVRNISPVDRTRLIAMTWERAPDLIELVDDCSDFRSVECVLTSNWNPAAIEKKLESCGLSIIATNRYVKTWSVNSGIRPLDRNRHVRVCAIREVLSLGVEFALAGLLFVLVFGTCNIGRWRLAVSVTVAIALGFVALSHPLLSPNGLGTYGGKARILYECGCIPTAFLESAGCMVLQPSYPPGLTLLAYLHYALSGGCGDRLVQMLVVFAMGFVCLAMLRRAKSPAGVLPVVLFCISPDAIRMTSGFYAEPFAALALLSGWDMIKRGKLSVGALFMGIVGLFRPEAGIIAVVFVAGACTLYGAGCDRFMAMVFSFAPALIWLVVSRILGYGPLPDWNFCALPDFEQIIYAVRCEVKSIATVLLPIAVLALLIRPVRKLRMRQSAIAAYYSMFVLLIVIPFICAFHVSANASWMIDNVVPRLLWYISAVPLLELFQFDAGDGDERLKS